MPHSPGLQNRHADQANATYYQLQMRHMQATDLPHRRARLSAPAGIATVGDGAGAVGEEHNGCV